jgi:hypothetical protein
MKRLILALTALAPLAAVENVAVNGDFSAKDAAGAYTGWTVWGDPKQVSIGSEDGNRFLRVDTSPRKSDGGLIQEIEVRPDWSAVKISIRMRVSKMATPAAEDKAFNRPIFHFLAMDSAGKPVAGPGEGQSAWSKVLVDGDSDWKTYTALKTFPAGIETLKLECRVLGAQAIADYDDVVIEPVVRQP